MARSVPTIAVAAANAAPFHPPGCSTAGSGRVVRATDTGIEGPRACLVSASAWTGPLTVLRGASGGERSEDPEVSVEGMHRGVPRVGHDGHLVILWRSRHVRRSRYWDESQRAGMESPFRHDLTRANALVSAVFGGSRGARIGRLSLLCDQRSKTTSTVWFAASRCREDLARIRRARAAFELQRPSVHSL